MLSKGVALGNFKPVISLLINPLDEKKKSMDKSIIDYFEEGLQNMRSLIEIVRKRVTL